MRALAWLALALLVAAPAAGRAQGYRHARVLDAPDGEPGGLFGGALAAGAGLVVVGAPGSDAEAPDGGAAWVGDVTGGALRPLAPAPRPAAGARVGHAVALVDGLAAVGAPHAGEAHAGAVHLFDAAGAHRAHVPAPAPGGLFGSALAAVDWRLAVGAPFAAAALGEVLLVDPAAGTVVRTIRNPNAGAYDLFGAALAGGGGRLAVGAPLDDGAGANAGAVHVFDAGGALRWTARSPAPAAGDCFGAAVAIVGDAVLVGAPFDDGAASDAGAAYLFDGATGALLARLADPEPRRDARLGSAVAAHGAEALVGAPFADGGAVLVFDTAGRLLERLAPPDARPGAQFGATIAADGGIVAVGSWIAGAVHVFLGAGVTTTTSTTTPTTSSTSATAAAPATTTTSAPVGTTPGAGTTVTTSTTASTALATTSTAAAGAPAGTTTTTVGAPAESTTTTAAAPASSTTTLPEGALPCDDGDPCTEDAAAEGGCRARPVAGVAGAACRLGGLAALLRASPVDALGGPRLAARLARRTAVVAAELARAEADPARARRALRRARLALRRLLATVGRAARRGRVLPVLADGVRAAAEDALARLAAAG